jgi:RNA polymerase sigma-70 factor (ECF subfamily)
MHHEGEMSDQTRPELDADALRRCLQRYLADGDEEAMEEIVRRTRPVLLRIALRIGSTSDSEDAVQSAYFSLLRKRGESLDIPVLPWLKTTVIRIAYRQKAVQQRQHEIARRLSRPAGSPSPLQEIVTGDEAVRVRREIARLPSTYRDPVVLRYLEGLSTAETADLLGLPEATIRTRLHRARRLLRGRLPASMAYAVACVPWLVTDLLGKARDGLLQLGSSSVLPAPAAALVIALAGALGSLAGSAIPVEARRASPVEDRVVEGERDPREAKTLRERVGNLLARGHEAELRRQTSLHRLAALRGEARGLLESREPGDPSASPPPVAIAGFEEALGNTSWNRIGAALSELTRLLDDLAGNLRAGAEPDPTHPGRAQELNGILVQLYARLQGAIDERDVNLVVSHPACYANALAATLRALGHPLTEEQRTAIARLAEAALLAEPVSREGDDRLHRRARLAEHRREFGDRVFVQLTEEQIAAVRPERTRDRLYVDAWSTTHVWHGGTALECFERPEHLVDDVTTRFARIVDLSTEQRETLREIVRPWVEALPGRSLAETTDPLTMRGWVPMDRVEEMVEPTRRLLRSIEDRIALSPAQIRRLRWVSGPVVPIRLPRREG